MRSAAGTIVGWLIVIVIVWIVAGWVFALLRWVIRTVLILALLAVLVTVYARLTDDEPST